MLTRTQVLDHVWGYGTGFFSNVVDICVHYLRNKDRPGLCRTIDPNCSGVGGFFEGLVIVIGTALRRRRLSFGRTTAVARPVSAIIAWDMDTELRSVVPVLVAARLRLVAWNVSVLSLFLLLVLVRYTRFHTNIYRAVDQQLQNQQALTFSRPAKCVMVSIAA